MDASGSLDAAASRTLSGRGRSPCSPPPRNGRVRVGHFVKCVTRRWRGHLRNIIFYKYLRRGRESRSTPLSALRATWETFRRPGGVPQRHK